MTARLANAKRVKIARWVKYTYRIFWKDGTSKYVSRSIAQLEGQTNKDTIEYLVKDFKSHIGFGDAEKVKLISVDGEKVNREIT